MAKQLGGYKEEQEPPEQPDYVDTADVQRWCFLCLSAIHPGDFYAREAVKGMPPTHVRSYHVDCYEAMRAIRKNKYASCVF